MNAQCGRKMAYPKRKQAVKAAGRRWRADGVRLRIYFCAGRWYLTSWGAE